MVVEMLESWPGDAEEGTWALAQALNLHNQAEEAEISSSIRRSSHMISFVSSGLLSRVATAADTQFGPQQSWPR